MPPLASALLESKAINPALLARAIHCQMMQGEHLTLHLLELGVSEAALAQALAQAKGADVLEGELPRANQTALHLVPREIAIRYRIYPLAYRGGKLEVVSSEPLPEVIEREIEAALGLPTKWRLAPLPRVIQALARDYRLPITTRVEKMLDTLPKAPPPAIEPALESAPEPRSPKPAKAPPVAKAAPKPRPARRLGPMTVAMAKEALEEASSRDEILSAFFDFARQFFEYSAFFIVQRDIAEGFDAHGQGGDRDMVAKLRVPLDIEGKLADARERKLPLLARLGDAEGDALLREGISRSVQKEALFLPLVLRNRVVAILYGDHGEDAVELSDIGDVLALAPLMTQSLEKLILRRKRKKD